MARRRTRSGRFAKGRRNPKAAMSRQMPLMFPSPTNGGGNGGRHAPMRTGTEYAGKGALDERGPWYQTNEGQKYVKAAWKDAEKAADEADEARQLYYAHMKKLGIAPNALAKGTAQLIASERKKARNLKREAKKAAAEAKKAKKAAAKATKARSKKTARKEAAKAKTAAKKATTEKKKAKRQVGASTAKKAKAKVTVRKRTKKGVTRGSFKVSGGGSRKRRKGGGKKGGGGKARKASRKRSGRGRRISAALRRKMKAGLRRYWASQKKRGGAPARLRRKLSAAIKAHPPLSKAERAFRRTNPKRKRRRRNPSALLVNPRRRNPAMRRRRRNPGLGGVAMQVLKTGGPALATAAALGALDVKVFSEKPKIVGILAKLGVGVGALIGLRGKPQFAVPIACAAFASIGTDLGVKLVGGVVGGSKKAAAEEVAKMAGEDEETFGVLLNEMQGLGILAVEGMGNPVDEAAAAFEGTEPLDVGDF